MYIVSKGKEKVYTPDKVSAKTIINAMNDMDAYEAMSIRSIEGMNDKAETLTLEFAGYTTDVLGKDSVLTLTLWVLMLGGKSIHISQKED